MHGRNLDSRDSTLVRFVGLLDTIRDMRETTKSSLSESDTSKYGRPGSFLAVEERREEKTGEDLSSAEVQQLINALVATPDTQTICYDSQSVVATTSDSGNLGERMSDQVTPKAGKIHKCPECSKTFPRKNSLHRHLILHTDQRPFQCNLCEANYKSHTQLARHMRLHSGEKPAKCEHCGREFRTYNELYTHRRTHTGEKPFECQHCGKCFSTRGSRNTHERIHTGVKPHKCEFCGAKFADASALRVHRFTHTGEQPYKCRVCGKRFSQTGNLNKHLKNVHAAR